MCSIEGIFSGLRFLWLAAAAVFLILLLEGIFSRSSEERDSALERFEPICG